MTAKIGWKCIIPGCTSLAKAPGHYFPKNIELIKKWLEAVSVLQILNLPEQEVRKCIICHLHFSENSYIFSLNRRRLKHDAVPNQNLSSTTVETDISQPSISEVQRENTLLESNINIEKESKQETHPLDVDILETSKHVRPTNLFCRNILGSVTRKDHLTPIAKRIYVKSNIITKQNNALRNNLKYKQRLKYATKFSNLSFWKQYSELSETQKLFINMQVKNKKKKRKVNSFIFCKKIKLALKSTCSDEHASIFLENIGID